MAGSRLMESLSFCPRNPRHCLAHYAMIAHRVESHDWHIIAVAFSQSKPMTARLDITMFFIDEEKEACDSGC
jgi:hypothetical protein